MDLVSGSDVLAQVGASDPSAYETEWADLVAAAVNDGIAAQLGSAYVLPVPAPAELVAAARLAGANAYKRREIPFGFTNLQDLQGQAVRVSRDYLADVGPMVARYQTEWGIG